MMMMMGALQRKSGEYYPPEQKKSDYSPKIMRYSAFLALRHTGFQR